MSLGSRASLSSRFSRSSRVKPERHEGTSDVPKIMMHRETNYGQNPYGNGQNQMPNLPDEYLLTLSDDSGWFFKSTLTLSLTFLDYCSSDWDTDSETSLDPEEMKKEGRIGYFLLAFTFVYLSMLITAYVLTSATPLCVCHPNHPK